MNWQKLPEELKRLKQWCITGAGADKSPHVAEGDSLHRVSVHDLQRLHTFEDACALGKKYGRNIGFMLTKHDGFCCIDLDIKDANSKDKKGNPYPVSEWTTQGDLNRYLDIIHEFDTYAEFSQSGKGVHLWVNGNIGKGVRRDGVEIYSQERFIICTGDCFTSMQFGIKDGIVAAAALNPRSKPINSAKGEVLSTMLTQMPSASMETELIEVGEEISDAEVLHQAISSKHGEKFQSLQKGEWQQLDYPSQSEADMALMAMLVLHSKSNEQCRRLFRASALGKRKKANRNDYLDGMLRVLRNPSTIVQAPISTISSSAIHLLTEDEVLGLPMPRWRIKHLVPEQGLVSIYGAPGSGKSFLALHLAAAIGGYGSFFGYKVYPCPVIYAVLEGPGGFGNRIRAYRMAFNRKLGNVRFFKDAINLRTTESRKQLIAAIKRTGYCNGVLIIDTLAASSPGIDENTSTDMGALIEGFKELQQALGGCVVIIHHSGKDRDRGLRGWSGLLAALDVVIEVANTGTCREFTVTKSKDGESGIKQLLDLRTVDVGLDEDNEPVTSCVIEQLCIKTQIEDARNTLLMLVEEYYRKGVHISPARNSPGRADKILRGDDRYKQLKLKNVETCKILDALVKDNLLYIDEVRTPNANTKNIYIPKSEVS